MRDDVAAAPLVSRETEREKRTLECTGDSTGDRGQVQEQ